MFVNRHCILCGQSYKVSMIVNYDSRVVPDLKIHHNILQSRNLRLQSLDKIGHWCRNIWSANRLCHNQILPQKPNDFFLKKWSNPSLFFVYFQSFQTNNRALTTNQCVKMSCPSSIQCQDSNLNYLNMSHLPYPLDQGSRPPNQMMFCKRFSCLLSALSKRWTLCQAGTLQMPEDLCRRSLPKA